MPGSQCRIDAMPSANGKGKGKPATATEAFERGVKVAGRVATKMHSYLRPSSEPVQVGPPMPLRVVAGRTVPRDPDTVFAELAGMIEVGAIDLARAVFHADVIAREDWHFARGRMTEDAHARFDAGERESHQTTAKERAKDWHRRIAVGQTQKQALKEMAAKDNCSENAMRQSLKLAGITVTTKSDKR